MAVPAAVPRVRNPLLLMALAELLIRLRAPVAATVIFPVAASDPVTLSKPALTVVPPV